jgi:hypothetical protein
MKKKPTSTRNDPEVMQLAASAECDPRTVIRVLEGKGVRTLVERRIRQAAERLKIKLPPMSSK